MNLDYVLVIKGTLRNLMQPLPARQFRFVPQRDGTVSIGIATVPDMSWAAIKEIEQSIERILMSNDKLWIYDCVEGPNNIATAKFLRVIE